MKAKHLFMVFSVIGWSIALAALYQWSQPATNPFSTAVEPRVQAVPVQPGQMEHSMQYLVPPAEHNSHQFPRFQHTPHARHPQPQVVEI